MIRRISSKTDKPTPARAQRSSIELLDRALHETQHWLDDAVSPYAVASHMAARTKRAKGMGTPVPERRWLSTTKDDPRNASGPGDAQAD